MTRERRSRAVATRAAAARKESGRHRPARGLDRRQLRPDRAHRPQCGERRPISTAVACYRVKKLIKARRTSGCVSKGGSILDLPASNRSGHSRVAARPSMSGMISCDVRKPVWSPFRQIECAFGPVEASYGVNGVNRVNGEPPVVSPLTPLNVQRRLATGLRLAEKSGSWTVVRSPAARLAHPKGLHGQPALGP